ncbi:MAG TPA: TIGR03668 family PPOX class F420-dependent oxidoreductase [Solirubrobacteraceae bacterium]|nr:TIGR03668 family PPOX class F420-dependent oxidoreductase [Solirubrobacteraceae bacterium]
MAEARCRALMAAARVGRLATVRPDGRPHVVACCFAVQADRLWTAVDAKPKTTTRLQRLVNVRARPWASLLVDHYEDDWDALWWVRADGPATVLAAGEEHRAALGALVAKYPQYELAAPSGEVIAVVVERWRGWSGR